MKLSVTPVHVVAAGVYTMRPATIAALPLPGVDTLVIVNTSPSGSVSFASTLKVTGALQSMV